MTPKTRGHLKRGWDLGKIPVVLGSILLLMQQAVALRGDLLKQQESQTVVASTIAAQGRDISRLSVENAALKLRVTRLERAPRQTLSTQRAAVAVDTVDARSPGLLAAAINLARAPFRFLGAVLKGG